MAAVADATLIIETLLGRTLTAEQLGRIGDAYVLADPYNLGSYADPQNPTNEEKAQLFLDTTLRHGQETVRQGKRHSLWKDNIATIDAQVNTAVADIEP